MHGSVILGNPEWLLLVSRRLPIHRKAVKTRHTRLYAEIQFPLSLGWIRDFQGCFEEGEDAAAVLDPAIRHSGVAE